MEIKILTKNILKLKIEISGKGLLFEELHYGSRKPQKKKKKNSDCIIRISSTYKTMQTMVKIKNIYINSYAI